MEGHVGGSDGGGICTKLYIHLIRTLWEDKVNLQSPKSSRNLGGGPFLGITLSGREAWITYNYRNDEYYVYYILKGRLRGRLQQDPHEDIYDRE